MGGRPIAILIGASYRFRVNLSAAILALALFMGFLGRSSKEPPMMLRLHGEGAEHEGEAFVVPVQIPAMQRKVFIRKVPIVSEKDIRAILPFTAPDGSLGCILQLDRSGSERIEQHTSAARDSVVVAMVNGRLASAMRVDRKIQDGIVTVASGLTPGEILILQARYPTLGKEKDFPRQKKDALAALAKAEKKLAAEKKKAERQKRASPAGTPN